MTKKQRLAFLRRWHIRIGIAAALFLVVLSVTGILINHSQHLSSDQKTLPKWLAHLSYGLSEIPVQTITVGELQAQAHSGLLYLISEGANKTYSCNGSVQGTSVIGQELWIACDQQINLFLQSDDFPHIEQLDTYSGLPTPISRLGICNQLACVESGQQIYQYSSEQNRWGLTPNEEIDPVWTDTPAREPKIIVPLELNWDRWLLDLHAGRLFGTLGIWLVDLSGVAIILLVFSGIARWITERRR